MYDVENFDAVFEHGGYSESLVNDIQTNQHALGGRTFFERLLDVLGIKLDRRMYPPSTPTILLDLHMRITNSRISLHYKHCLIFYMLKDISSSSPSMPDVAQAMAKNVHLDKRFYSFIEGIWELDHLQFETAVQNLTYPGLIATFPDEILMVLLTRGGMGVGGRGGAGGAKQGLAAAYFECVNPPLKSEAVRREYAAYLARRNVTEMYYWIRSRPDEEHYPLLEILVQETLSREHAHDDPLYPREDKAEELVSLPFTEEEEDWLEQFLSEGRGRALRGAEDTVNVRRIANGKFAEFVGANGSKGRRYGGVNWEGLRDGVRRGIGARGEVV
ncbi:hypothetical protein K458DRAFT_447784 [Lentithecium fluviatile CBS 122367]|uniref:ELYS-like domain-containing protein n=1 Tax=Lentithecium fluviatile CBS 122367 TaxID=1168545 RepID=A0A6G1IDC4_9PLEO|nr:hypothetical protein K458DRAFT_447784 [Lentithecium fluviatile CBS 122367]